ncbi:type I-E CRISPR-associated protein Cse1/CasA [Actinomyces sp. HPA0247]|uniref:type I-E CRISPR-associated protein Cse1/CasA n=1 Tax=Actinomyces sp. HPA0247 TaxID=1203556 RepID=UPI0009FBEF06
MIAARSWTPSIRRHPTTSLPQASPLHEKLLTPYDTAVWIKGNDLDETIVLNLIPSDSGRLEGGDNSSDWGACTWEKADPWTANRDDYSVAGKKGTTKAESLSIPKLMTWQSRRVRLFGDSAGVTKVLVCQGDKLTPHNMFRYEPQSMWRYDSGASKKSVDVYKAFNFTADRAMWRNLPGVFCPQVKVKVGGRSRSR